MNNWIKIEDEIPEYGQAVLIFLKDEKQIAIAERIQSGSIHSEEDSVDYWSSPYDDFVDWEWDVITHWRLLPEKPEV